jgi:hypothetical protein
MSAASTRAAQRPQYPGASRDFPRAPRVTQLCNRVAYLYMGGGAGEVTGFVRCDVERGGWVDSPRLRIPHTRDRDPDAVLCGLH